MYWPIGTPRVYATSASRAPTLNFVRSDDGLSGPPPQPPPRDAPEYLQHHQHHPRSSSFLSVDPHRPGHGQEDADLPTPITPITPAVQSIEDDHHDPEASPPPPSPSGKTSAKIPVGDPVLALRVSRTGHMFVVITSTSITIWQTKVRTDNGFAELSSS